MSSEHNSLEITNFLKKLKELGKDIEGLPEEVITEVSNRAVAYAKRRSPVITGKFRDAWNKGQVKKDSRGVECKIENTMDYASYVNYGHRTVDGEGRTTGYVTSKKGDHLLEKTLNYAEKKVKEKFRKMISEINARHD